jgi:hypothetical protein
LKVQFTGPNKKGLHIIGQIIDYVTDLKNVTLLDYGGAVTWRHLELDSEGQRGINPRPRGKNVLNVIIRMVGNDSTYFQLSTEF